VYDCQWGTITVRVVVAGQLAQKPHNAPLHLFSAQPALIEFGGRAYKRRPEDTSGLLLQLFRGFQAEGTAMPFTMNDFRRQFVKEHFPELTRKEREDVIQSLPPEERLAGLTQDEIRAYLEKMAAENPAPVPKRRRKK
jgi:hypothetical protein